MPEHFNLGKTAYMSNLRSRKSAYAEHLLKSNHNFDLSNCKPLHYEPSWKKRIAIEQYEILRHRKEMGELVLNKYFLTNGIIPAFVGHKEDEQNDLNDLHFHPDLVHPPAYVIDLDSDNSNKKNNTGKDLTLQREMEWLESVD